MLKVEHIEVWGFEHAVRGMRNPLNSWDKSDSGWEWVEDESPINPDDPGMSFAVGETDLDLMRRLYKAGPEHRKYLRQIFVSMDITAPLYLWKEIDQYKVGTTTDSCSTMHKIAAKEFTLDDFSTEHLSKFQVSVDNGSMTYMDCAMDLFKNTIALLNTYRDLYLYTKEKVYWWQLIQLLPSSYNQKRTVTMSYENVVSIIKQRSGHKLDEWHVLIDEFKKNLPYINEIISEENN